MSNSKVTRRTILKGAGAAVAGIVGAPYIITGASAARAEHRMIFGHTFGAATADYMVTGLAQFKAVAEEMSGGKLLVDIHEAGSLGGQTVLPQKVLTGSVQGCQLSTTNFANFSDVYNVLDFPFLFPSNEKFQEVIGTDEFFASEFVTRPAEQGFQIVPGMWANAGFRALGVSQKVDKVIRRPGDLDGMKVRTNGTPVEEVLFNLSTANPVSIAWGEAYQAMQQGAADALSVGLGPLTASKIYETLGSATLYGLNFNCHVTVLSKKWFDALPEDIQQAILTAGRQSFEFQKTEQAKADLAMLELWKGRGIEVVELTDDERAEWLQTVGHVRPEYDALKDKLGRGAFETLTGLIGA